jgi:hypothetical protein
MNFFLLTLIAKRNDDGTFRYSTSILQDGASNRPAFIMNFESEAAFRAQVNAVLPNRIEANHMIQEAKAKGYCSVRTPLLMRVVQAEKFGWLP